MRVAIKAYTNLPFFSIQHMPLFIYYRQQSHECLLLPLCSARGIWGLREMSEGERGWGEERDGEERLRMLRKIGSGLFGSGEFGAWKSAIRIERERGIAPTPATFSTLLACSAALGTL